jgi:hypothetical protein
VLEREFGEEILVWRLRVEDVRGEGVGWAVACGFERGVPRGKYDRRVWEVSISIAKQHGEFGQSRLRLIAGLYLIRRFSLEMPAGRESGDSILVNDLVGDDVVPKSGTES